MRTQSHSSLDKYETCPMTYYATYITKEVRFTASPATEFGLALHSAIENFYKTGEDPVRMPTHYKDGNIHYAKLKANAVALHNYKPTEILVEHKMAFKHDMQACDYWSVDAMFRGILDVLAIFEESALLADHKTGKEVTNSKQLYRNALAIFLAYPAVNTVYTAYWHSDPTITDAPPKAIKRAEMLDIYNEIKNACRRIDESEAINCWMPKPSGLCGASKRSPYPGCPVASCKHSAFYRA